MKGEKVAVQLKWVYWNILFWNESSLFLVLSYFPCCLPVRQSRYRMPQVWALFLTDAPRLHQLSLTSNNWERQEPLTNAIEIEVCYGNYHKNKKHKIKKKLFRHIRFQYLPNSRGIIGNNYKNTVWPLRFPTYILSDSKKLPARAFRVVYKLADEQTKKKYKEQSASKALPIYERNLS